MIIVDLSQISISSIMAQIGNHTNIEINEDLVRHIVLNRLRLIRQKFKDYGEMVIACDDKHNWRKQVFPYYKANRKKMRDSSELDWGAIFEALNNIKQEIKDNFPYVVIQIDRAEADDVIGALVGKYGNLLNNDITEKIVIISGDKDFVQLQQYSNVEQYDPVRKKFINHDNPSKFIKEQIIRGDAGDGVPNFLSDDDCFVTGQRQKKITEKKLTEWLTQDVDSFADQMKRNYKRNQQLIDLSFTPKEIVSNVIEAYDTQKSSCSMKRTKMFNYFVSKKLKNLMENIGDF